MILLAALSVASLPSSWAGEPTDHWLNRFGLQRWELVFDPDGDGFTSGQEFDYGTDPLDAASLPYGFFRDLDRWWLRFAAPAGVQWQLDTSTDLRSWAPAPNLAPPTNGVITLELVGTESQRFYRPTVLAHLNSDGDCLLDFEELTLDGTNPLLADTDGDGLDDCAEVTVYHTDPNFRSPTGRGAIRGAVVLDEDHDPATQDHPGLGGWTVFLDLDLDGEAGHLEPSAVSQADGSYRISQLDPGRYRVRVETRPGWVQVFPSPNPPATPDGYPDRVVRFFDSGTGPIPGPYGNNAAALPGARLILGDVPQPVNPDIVLGALPDPIVAPVGHWAHVDWLNLPKDSEVTVAFDGEEIVDGPGEDLWIFTEVEQGSREQAEVYLGSTDSNLTFAKVISGGSPAALDLAELAVPRPVRFLKLKSLTTLGYFPGMEVVGFQAVNYRPARPGHYDVDVVGGETIAGINFGVIGEDRPPHVFVSLDDDDLSAGQPAQVTVRASDDVGVSAVTLRANGVAVPLDASLRAPITPSSGGLLELFATATDTAGQTAETRLSQIVRNSDGSLPDLSGLAVTGTQGGGPGIRITSPVAGEILDAPRVIIGTLFSANSSVASWRVDYALADQVNPEALADPDPDYVLLEEGTGPVTSASLGTLAGDTLPAGAYFVRVSATDSQGTIAYLGFVVGVRVDPLDIRPAIVLTRPTNETTITFLTNIIGSVTTRQQLREWYVEYALLSRVNLQNLSDPAPTWTRIAGGTNPVADARLATFDPTLLPNDSYVVRVTAWNRNGLGWAQPLVVHVAGGAKLGNFAVEFTDVELPLAGIPITVKRAYDSLNANRTGDFGAGWSLALQDADIAETVPQTGSGLGSTPFRVGARVYLTAPDGQRIGFTFQPQIGAVSFLGAVYSAVFKPDPGVRYTLTVPEGDAAFLTVTPAGEAVLFFLPLPWNPDTYVLTDTQGTRHTYDQNEGLVQIADANGNRVTFTDDAIEHSAGERIRLARDPSGRITQIVAPDGAAWAYEYDATGDLVRVTYPGGIVATFGYAASRAHFLETINDPMHGPGQRTEYDADGRVTAVIDAAGNRVEQTWDPGSFSGVYTDARGNLTELIYNARGNLTRRVDPLGGVTTWEYANPDFPDLETRTTDPRGNRTTFTYDARGNLLQVNYPLRQGTTHTYNDQNRILSKQYGTGGERFEYDSLGNLIRYQSPLGEWTLTHTAGGLLASVLDGEGGLTRLEYDTPFSLPSRIVSSDGSVKAFLYDASGQLTQYTDPLGNQIRFEYDRIGRLVRQVDARGGEIRTAYDPVFPQQPAAETNRVGGVTQYAYDALGRVRQITTPGGAVTRYEYDVEGNLAALVDPVGNRSEFTYDSLGRLAGETDPLGKRRLYSYDLAGNQTNRVDRLGRRRSFLYDALNRVSEERWHDPATDSVVRTIQFGYDRLDRLRAVEDPDAQETLSWVGVPGGQIGSDRTTYPGRSVGILLSDFDAGGRRVDWQLFGTLHARYTRDVAGRLRIITGEAGATNRWRLELWRNARGDLAELRRFADWNGTVPVGSTIYAYDPCGCGLASIQQRDALNQPLPGASLFFTRDGEGRITELLDGTNNLAFTYDAEAQLTGVTRDGVPVESYAYDAGGNRLASHRQSAYTNSPGNRLTGTTDLVLAYDDEGNLLTKSNRLTGDVFNFTWDHRNRLAQVAKTNAAPPGNGFVTDYRYDAFDRRIAVIRGGQTNWTYYEGLQPIADYLNDETTPVERYFPGEDLDDLHVVVRRGERYYWTLIDHLGTVRGVLGTNGVEVAALQYDSFGNRLSAAGGQPGAAGRFAYTGREWDADTGLYYYRARYYDPELGRFISEDPLGFEAGDHNFYRYVGNTPTGFRDPLGLNAAGEYGLFGVRNVYLRGALCAVGGSAAGLLTTFALEALEVPGSGLAGLVVGEVVGLACIKITGPRPPKPGLGPKPPKLEDKLDMSAEAIRKRKIYQTADSYAPPRSPNPPRRR